MGTWYCTRMGEIQGAAHTCRRKVKSKTKKEKIHSCEYTSKIRRNTNHQTKIIKKTKKQGHENHKPQKGERPHFETTYTHDKGRMAAQTYPPPHFEGEKLRDYYPEISPYSHGFLKVGDGHQMYFEECGNPEGLPCVFVHGGPGGGCTERVRRFFDPARCRIVLFDQRGCGRSKPNASVDLDGSLRGNNTPKLVSDIELLREHLGIKQWGIVCGGSWGATLSLRYAECHPKRVLSILLRGVFTMDDSEIDYLFQDGTAAG